MKKKVFNNDLIIHSQVIRRILYLDGLDIEISDCELNYNILRHTEKERDFKVQLFLELENFRIFVEGHYEVSEHIPKDRIKKFIDLGGLSSLIPFLRYSILNVTSATKEGGLHLPPIDLALLVKTQMEKNLKESNKKKSKTAVSKKSSKKKEKKSSS